MTPNLQKLIELHATLLEENPYCYFELAYTRSTEWMAWICTDRYEDDSQRKVMTNGQGSTPDEAAADALAKWPNKDYPEHISG